ncbi:hypothetical protein BS47DRAFT_1356636, partial [Hydnum rufescens UP504]
CLQQGAHVPDPTRWGLLDLLSGLFCFPIGVVLCFVDRSVVCDIVGFRDDLPSWFDDETITIDDSLTRGISSVGVMYGSN